MYTIRFYHPSTGFKNSTLKSLQPTIANLKILSNIHTSNRNNLSKYEVFSKCALPRLLLITHPPEHCTWTEFLKFETTVQPPSAWKSSSLNLQHAQHLQHPQNSCRTTGVNRLPSPTDCHQPLEQTREVSAVRGKHQVRYNRLLEQGKIAVPCE